VAPGSATCVELASPGGLRRREATGSRSIPDAPADRCNVPLVDVDADDRVEDHPLRPVRRI
jgi:hypothetical protein